MNVVLGVEEIGRSVLLDKLRRLHVCDEAFGNVGVKNMQNEVQKRGYFRQRSQVR